MATATTHQKLIKISVEGLLGRFDHEIHFNPDWQFLILHGPNGVGKTRLLELLHSVFTSRFSRLASIPFSAARFDFQDGMWVEVTRNIPHHQEELPIKSPADRRHMADRTERLLWRSSVLDPDSPFSGPSPAIRHEDRRLLSRIEQQSPVEQIDFDLWLDLPTGDELGPHEMAERYGYSLPSETESEGMPEALKAVLEDYEVHLIETQRLLGSNRSFATRRRARVEHRTPLPTVVSYAEDLSRQLDATLAASSRTSQTLDRSFPSRLFQEVSAMDTEDELRDRYAEQLELRSRLANIAILDSSADLRLPERTLQEWERRVLRTYLNDAADKLKTFQPLLDRLELLREIVNERFLFKKLEFDQKQGFAFADEDSGMRVDLRHLSSGEQHEVVLMYDLLMNVKEHSLVLIDEPEISLHVAWQKAFLDDLDRVSSLTSLRFIIATHSPQIIGSWWDRAISLYSVS